MREVNHSRRIMCDEFDLATVDKKIQTRINLHKLCLFQQLNHYVNMDLDDEHLTVKLNHIIEYHGQTNILVTILKKTPLVKI